MHPRSGPRPSRSRSQRRCLTSSIDWFLVPTRTMRASNRPRQPHMTKSLENFLGRLLIALPLLSLALCAIAWLRYGIDIPWFDDWRGYAAGTMNSLSPGHLFRPINDTLAPVGWVLDALAQRYLDGNSVAYQFLSMVTVLGSLLL